MMKWLRFFASILLIEGYWFVCCLWITYHKPDAFDRFLESVVMLGGMCLMFLWEKMRLNLRDL